MHCSSSYFLCRAINPKPLRSYLVIMVEEVDRTHPLLLVGKFAGNTIQVLRTGIESTSKIPTATNMGEHRYEFWSCEKCLRCFAQGAFIYTYCPVFIDPLA